VVVEQGGRHSEPYLGRPPAEDDCFVFGQHPLETAFVLDLRLRDRLSALVDGGHRIAKAILVWDRLEPSRDILRRAHLVARRLGPGGKVILTTKRQSTTPDAHFQQFAEQLALDLRWLGVDLVVATATPASSAPAPLTAAWNRLQRFRGFAAFEDEGAALDVERESEAPVTQTRMREPFASDSREVIRSSAVFTRRQRSTDAVAIQQVRGAGRR